MGYGTSAEVLWHDRKRYYGLPLSFEVYEMSEDRLFLTNGVLQQDYRQILLYRVRDIQLRRSFSQRCFGVGTVTVKTSDNKTVELENIREPIMVKELLHHHVENQKRSRRFHYGEYEPYRGEYIGLFES